MEYSIEQLREIVELVKRKHYDELEEKWLELAEDPPREMRFYDSMARALLKNGERDRLTELFNIIAGAMTAKGRAAEAVEAVRAAWRHAPDLAGLREPAREALKVLHGARAHFRSFASAAGLDQRTDLFRALQRFEEFVACDVGEVFEHKTFGIGVVETIEPERRRVAIRFPGKAPKEFTLEGVRDFLKKLERGGFFAERLRDPEALKRKAVESPTEFVRYVLKDHPEGLTPSDFKSLLLDGFMTREEWDEWWGDSRRAIRRDPYVDLERGSRGVMRLRTEPKTYYEAVAEEFRDSDSASTRQAVISEIAKHVGDEAPPPHFAHDLVELLVAEFGALDDGDDIGRLERVYLAQDAAQVFGDLTMPATFDPAAVLAQAADPAALVLGLSSFDFQCRAIEALTARDRARATEICARLLPDAGPRLAQWLMDRLIAQGAIAPAAAAFTKILRTPDRNPEMFLWAARQFFADKYAALALEIESHTVIREMAEFIRDLQNQIDHRVANTPTLRGIVMKLKNFLAEDHYEILRHAVTPLPVEEARGILRLFESHAAFPDGYLGSLRMAIQDVRPDVEETGDKPGPNDLDASVLYVTLESLQRRNGELQQLRSVEIPKNSKEIGEAASLGDLSENAEYEAARHRQRMLFKRAEELQKEIEMARPIVPEWVRTDMVWPGTRVQVRSVASGEVETYTILGAWDSKPDEKVVSYLTPTAAQFLRKRVGDRILVQRPAGDPAQYEILSIENALASQGT